MDYRAGPRRAAPDPNGWLRDPNSRVVVVARRYRDGMLVRECNAADLGTMKANLGGNPSIYDGLFAMQEAGACTYVVAWQGGVPVGYGVVRWGHPRADELRGRFPGCPEISNLQVAGPLQRQGIGTALVAAAEARIRARGCPRAGLGVDDGNDRALRLYMRLGYRPVARYVDRYRYVDGDGVPHDAADPATFLLKYLPDL